MFSTCIKCENVGVFRVFFAHLHERLTAGVQRKHARDRVSVRRFFFLESLLKNWNPSSLGRCKLRSIASTRHLSSSASISPSFSLSSARLLALTTPVPPPLALSLLLSLSFCLSSFSLSPSPLRRLLCSLMPMSEQVRWMGIRQKPSRPSVILRERGLLGGGGVASGDAVQIEGGR